MKARKKGRRKPGRPTKLTPEVQAQIVEDIEAGAYDWVAAQAAGIDSSTFCRWMNRGEEGEEPFRGFREDVLRARAVSRMRQEKAVAADDPKFWLRCGPGKDKPGEPGWTETIRQDHRGQVAVTFAEAIAEGEKPGDD